MDNTSNNPTKGQEPNVGPSGQEPTSKGQEPNESPKQQLSREDYESIITDLRTKDAEKRIKLKEFEDTQKKQEQAAAKALEERLKQQGEFQKLAEQHEARVKELEPTVERFNSLTSLVSEQIEAQIKDWPAEAKIFDPGKDAPIESRLDWMNKAKALVDKLNANTAPQSRPGNGPNPKPASPTPEGLQQRLENQLRASGKYRA